MEAVLAADRLHEPETPSGTHPRLDQYQGLRNSPVFPVSSCASDIHLSQLSSAGKRPVTPDTFGPAVLSLKLTNWVGTARPTKQEAPRRGGWVSSPRLTASCPACSCGRVVGDAGFRLMGARPHLRLRGRFGPGPRGRTGVQGAGLCCRHGNPGPSGTCRPLPATGPSGSRSSAATPSSKGTRQTVRELPCPCRELRQGRGRFL